MSTPTMAINSHRAATHVLFRDRTCESRCIIKQNTKHTATQPRIPTAQKKMLDFRK